DVSIVRQLLGNFIDASREAASLLLLLPAEGLTSKLPDAWTPEDAPRLFYPPGAWQGSSAASAADPNSAGSPSASSVSERLLRLSERSAEALSLLPSQGRPVVGRDGLLREYRGVDTSELPDPGHRHWSGLWALYPGSQIASSGESQKIFQAAAATVHYKVDHGGGHTAWSRAWLVNLRARLFQGTEALNSLRGLMRDQCVGSLYSLHPALTRSSDKKLADCSSCYEWHGEGKARSPSTEKRQQSTRRENGLITADGAAFQIDGNLGVLAGVNEMLLQSHYRRRGDGENLRYSGPPKTPMIEIRLLPALPEDWPAGRFRGLRTRGGHEVDVEWDAGRVTEATVRLVAGFSEEGRGDVPRCRVISRSQLFVDGAGGGKEGEILRRKAVVDTVYEGGVLWHSIGMEALQSGEEVRLVAAGSRE
ncbi:unnamed protein product, partial [Laminaria digitata]